MGGLQLRWEKNTIPPVVHLSLTKIVFEQLVERRNFSFIIGYWLLIIEWLRLYDYT